MVQDAIGLVSDLDLNSESRFRNLEHITCDDQGGVSRLLTYAENHGSNLHGPLLRRKVSALLSDSPEPGGWQIEPHG